MVLMILIVVMETMIFIISLAITISKIRLSTTAYGELLHSLRHTMLPGNLSSEFRDLQDWQSPKSLLSSCLMILTSKAFVRLLLSTKNARARP